VPVVSSSIALTGGARMLCSESSEMPCLNVQTQYTTDAVALLDAQPTPG